MFYCNIMRVKPCHVQRLLSCGYIYMSNPNSYFAIVLLLTYSLVFSIRNHIYLRQSSDVIRFYLAILFFIPQYPTVPDNIRSCYKISLSNNLLDSNVSSLKSQSNLAKLKIYLNAWSGLKLDSIQRHFHQRYLFRLKDKYINLNQLVTISSQ